MLPFQLEVAERLAAQLGSKVYGLSSVKGAWYAAVRLARPLPRSVFWPVPNADSGLVASTRRSSARIARPKQVPSSVLAFFNQANVSSITSWIYRISSVGFRSPHNRASPAATPGYKLITPPISLMVRQETWSCSQLSS